VPIFSDDELDKAIEAEEIGAITLDTNIIDKFGHDFGHPMLRNLDQFDEIGVKIVFSDIVAREVQSHIARDAAHSLLKVRKALAQHKSAWDLIQTLDELGSSSNISGSPTNFARAKWQRFISDTNAIEVVAAGTVSVDTLIGRYFDGKPPFEKEGKKKAEFPDAIALLSLADRAHARKTKVLAVSADDGWKKFAEASDQIIVVQDIAKVLGHYNRASYFIAQRISLLIEKGLMPSIGRQVKEILENHFDDSSMEVEADSDLRFEVRGSLLWRRMRRRSTSRWNLAVICGSRRTSLGFYGTQSTAKKYRWGRNASVESKRMLLLKSSPSFRENSLMSLTF
jgi:hypothetical protein